MRGTSPGPQPSQCARTPVKHRAKPVTATVAIILIDDGMGRRLNAGEAAREPRASPASTAPRSNAPMATAPVGLQLGGSGNGIACSFVEDDPRTRSSDAVDRACHAIGAPMANKPTRHRGDAAGISE